MNDIDKLLARAQVGLTFLFAIGFLGILLALLLIPGINKEVSSLLTNMLTVLGTLLTLQLNFFFSRQRPPALPPPQLNGDTNVQPTTTGIKVTPASPPAK